MTPNGNGLEVCWWDGVGSPCQNSFEWFFFSEEAAQRYIDQRTEVDNALVGSWLIDEGPGARNVLTFIDNSRYVVFHEHTNADQTAGSGEYGNYTWDGFNFTSTVIDESDTQGGLGNNAFTAEVIGDQLFLDGETAIRIADPGNPIVGSWVIGSGDDLTVLTMLSSSEYALVHTLNTRCYGACTPQNLAGEFGSYTWDGYSFQVTGASVDTNGVDGFYDNENPANQQNELLEVNGATLTFTDAASESFVFNRVGAPTVNLVCGYESGWDDINERPLVFNSVNDYYEVRASCESQNGTYAFSTSSLAGLTFYEEGGETRFVFDGAGTSGVATDAGVDGTLDTSDDETFYVTASHFDTNVVKLEGSLTQGGAAVLSELWSLEYYNANELGDGKDYWVFTVFSEDYSWPESDGSVNIDDNKGGEIWHNNVSTASDFNWAGLWP